MPHHPCSFGISLYELIAIMEVFALVLWFGSQVVAHGLVTYEPTFQLEVEVLY